jgi:hypothetical protein
MVKHSQKHYKTKRHSSKKISKKSYTIKKSPTNKKDRIVEPIIEDDPLRRFVETTSDLARSDQQIGKLRLVALEHALRMPISDDGSLPPTAEDYNYSQPATPGKTNWLQLGPTATPDAQTLSTYYYWPANISAIVTGRITSIVIHPKNGNVIYVGTALGGVWKTIDGGRNWIPTSDYAPSLGIGALAMDPINSDILYAGTGEGNISWRETIGRGHPRNYYGCGILKTIDGGKKWKLVSTKNNPFNGASFYRIAINIFNPSIIFAATSYGLYRTIDGGESWIKMRIGLPQHDDDIMKVTDVTINHKEPGTVYAAIGGRGIFKSNDANENNPTWNELSIDDLDSKISTDRNRNITRMSLDISRTDPNILYVLAASAQRPFDERYEEREGYSGTFVVDRFYKIVDKGSEISWQRITLPGEGTKGGYPWIKDSIGGQGSYNLNIAVDPIDPDIVYLSGISLWKAVRNKNSDTWDIIDIGIPIHPDNHAFAFDPEYPFIIYAGNDGGLYKSTSGGQIWTDSVNEGFCITQFEFIDQHPNSDSIIFGGTQDNGTLQYRNSPAFYFSAYGDGGFVSIDRNNPNIVIHQYTNNHLYFSSEAGRIQPYSWADITVVDKEGNDPPCLFYAPFTLDQENPKNIAFGGDKIYLDSNQGNNKWKGLGGPIDLMLDQASEKTPAELVSAINFVNSNLLYAATIYGKIYRATKTLNGWKAARIDGGSLPKLYVWDVQSMPDNPDTIIAIMAGYGSETEPPSHIWSGTLSENSDSSFAWEPINGTGIGELPHTPINALIIDDKNPDCIYVGTDIGVFRTSNKGKSWIRFSENLPVCAVYDMRLHSQSRLLRVATHGRGMWERQLDVNSCNDVNLFVRNNLMDTGYLQGSSDITAGFSDALQGEDGGIKLNDKLTWDMCPDIKIDSPKELSGYYQFDDIDNVDYVKFESRLQHRNTRTKNVCNVYVQVHNRGIKPIVENVTIKMFYAYKSAQDKYPPLPDDFWTSNSSSSTGSWKQIIPTRNLPEGQKTLTNTEPTVLAWQWFPHEIGAKELGILVVVESSEDPIPKDSKEILDVEKLVRMDRHVGLRTIKITA